MMYLKEKLEEAYGIIKALEKQNKLLEGIVQKQGDKIIQLEKRIEELEGKQQTKEVPSFVKPDRKAKSHKLGNPKGHEGFSRPLPDHFDEEIDHKINKCSGCGSKLGKELGRRTRYVEDIILQ